MDILLDESEGDEEGGGSPAWMATFADLMSLLMCFFVLLLSFSEMDVLKYKQIAGSMREAFGVQNEIKVKDIPKGTSIIAREFSPGKPQPTQIKTVNQFTTQNKQQSLQVGNPQAAAVTGSELNDELTAQLLDEKLSSLLKKTRADAEKLRQVLKPVIDEGKIDIESHRRQITIRIRERGSFPSGSATLNSDFVPVMADLRVALQDIDGKISVEGHTDDVPIRGARFQSNWELSASRALSVTHELVSGGALDEERFMVVGLASTQPYRPNTSSKNRALNRRVEIIIRQGDENATTTTLNDLQKVDPGIIDRLDPATAAGDNRG
ncbi:MAG: type VI secretion system protein TssL [Halioglobus sp.]|nr:type VI secretion system protein TssL [Halioglobus sp.]|tara:strand:- start:5125 stop:6093 length:969 start_codon:yes stop_codon:yes gene_type:complete